MSFTRLLIIVLVVLNLLALAATRGLLGDNSPRGEPERLTNQLRPDAIRLLDAPPDRASAPQAQALRRSEPTADTAPEPATVSSTVVAETPPGDSSPGPDNDSNAPLCRTFGGLLDAQATELSRLARELSPGLNVRRSQNEPASNWWVHIPPAANREAADTRARALRASGISDLFVVRDAGPNQHAISLGIFRTQTSAAQHLADMRARGATEARMSPRNPPRYQLEVSGAASQVTRLEGVIGSRLPDVQGTTCAP